MPDDLEAALERDHFTDVLAALSSYAASFAPELERRSAAAAALPPSLSALLPAGALAAKLAGVRTAVAANQRVLDWIVAEQAVGEAAESLGAQVFGGGAPPPPQRTPSPAQAAKVRSVLAQIAREWSAEGSRERAASFGLALRLLRTHVPVSPTAQNTQRVLLPGCGLGRLVCEVAAGGWVAEGCEFSYGMLLCGAAILNGDHGQHDDTLCEDMSGGDTHGVGSRTHHSKRVIYPWATEASNVWRSSDVLRGVPFPDVTPTQMLAHNPGARMSVNAGDWMDVYKEEAGGRGGAEGGREGGMTPLPPPPPPPAAIVTCFFLDTAPCALSYIALIARLLRPGGVWVHVGPLQWHWAGDVDQGGPHSSHKHDASGGGGGDGHAPDERFVGSVELTWEEVRHGVVAGGFDILEEGACESAPYCGNATSMATMSYAGAFFAARRRVG